jgi:predicted ATPase/DNA-binding SARP family transcriptional activator
MDLRIQFFGPFRIWQDEQEITAAISRIGKADTLLKVLLSEPGRNFTREELVEYLWGEEIAVGKTREKTALGNLRRRVSALRTLLRQASREQATPEYILTTPEGYRWNHQANYRLDVEDCARHYEQAQEFQEQSKFSEAAATYEAARAILQGEYLEADRYAEWTIPLRQQWRETTIALLKRLAECYARLGQYQRAIACGREVTRLDERDEPAYRQLMLYHYLSGEQAEALRVYERYTVALKQQEIGEADKETKQLYEQIRAGHVPGIDQVYQPIAPPPFELPYTLSPGSIPFVGRVPELAKLKHLSDEARAGHGRFVLVTGEAGVGKTRLIQEFIIFASKRYKARVLHGFANELSGLSFWTEILRQALEEISDEGLKHIPALCLAEVARYVPELKQRIPNLAENEPLPPQQAQLRLFDNLSQFLLRLVEATSHQPLLIVVDDLQWADTASLDFLNYFLARIELKPVLIVGTYRTEEVTEEDPLKQLVAGWKEQNQEIPLLRLSASECDELLGKMPLRIDRSDLFASRLYRETEGNPLFLIATLQDLFEKGVLRVEGKAWVSETQQLLSKEPSLAPTIEDLIRRRLSRLSEPEEKLLSLASVVGRDGDARLFEQLYEGSREECHATLVSLTKKQLLVERFGQYELSHDMIREVVYKQISSPRRQLLHQRVLGALEQVYRTQLEMWAPVLAYHAQRAEQWKKALEYALQGLKRSVKEYRWREGLELADLGLGAVQKLEEASEDAKWLSEQRFDLWAEQLEIYDLQGQRNEQEDSLGHLQRLAERLGQKGRQAAVCQKRAHIYEKVGRYTEAEADALQAIELYQGAGDRQGHIDSLLELTRVYGSMGRYDAALHRSEEILELNQQIGDRSLQARVLHNRGNVYWWMGQYEAALACYREALETYRTVGQRRGQETSLTNIGLVLLSQGQFGEAVDYFRQSLEICRELGDRQGQADILNYLGAISYYQGQYDAALRDYEEALRIRQDISDRRGQADNLNNIGLIFHGWGQYGEAEPYYQKALEIYQEIGNERGRAQCLGNLGGLYRELGRRVESLDYYRTARSVFETMGNKDGQLMCFSAEGILHDEMGHAAEALAQSLEAVRMLEAGQVCELPQDVYFNHYRILAAHGRREDAPKYLEKAHAELMQRAEQIQDLKLRESFLKNVKANREIIEAWQKQDK